MTVFKKIIAWVFAIATALIVLACLLTGVIKNPMLLIAVGVCLAGFWGVFYLIMNSSHE